MGRHHLWDNTVIYIINAIMLLPFFSMELTDVSFLSMFLPTKICRKLGSR